MVDERYGLQYSGFGPTQTPLTIPLPHPLLILYPHPHPLSLIGLDTLRSPTAIYHLSISEPSVRELNPSTVSPLPQNPSNLTSPPFSLGSVKRSIRDSYQRKLQSSVHTSLSPLHSTGIVFLPDRFGESFVSIDLNTSTLDRYRLPIRLSPELFRLQPNPLVRASPDGAHTCIISYDVAELSFASHRSRTLRFSLSPSYLGLKGNLHENA
jgi:hypothetical protein